MGLFSILNKNKQEASLQDSGYYRADDDEAVAVKARSKRASSAGEGAPRRGSKTRATDDPVLPEKKRARRRLVGAIALALAVAVGLPMILDSEPKPLASDIAIQIPSKDKAAPLPAPAVSTPVPAAESLDQKEQIVEPAKAVVTAAPEVKTVAAKEEPKKVEAKPAEKPAKPVVKTEEKVAKPAVKDDPRAIALLEGRDEKAPAEGKFVLRIASLASKEKVAALQAKLKDAGIHSSTQSVSSKSGELIRVQVGPFSKDEAEKMKAKLEKLGLAGMMVAA